MFTFDEFAKKLSHLLLGSDQGLAAGGGCTIKLSVGSAFALLFRYEQSTLFEGMQQGVHCARAESIAVAGKFLNHPQAKDFTFTGMVKDVETNQA